MGFTLFGFLVSIDSFGCWTIFKYTIGLKIVYLRARFFVFFFQVDNIEITHYIVYTKGLHNRIIQFYLDVFSSSLLSFVVNVNGSIC